MFEAAWYEVQPLPGPAGPLHVQVTRYSLGLAPEQRAALSTDGFGLIPLGVAPAPQGTPEALWWGTDPEARTVAEGASVVVTHAAGRDPEALLAELTTDYPGCLIAGVVIRPGHCLTAVRRRPLAEYDRVFAHVMTVTGPVSGPQDSHLYPLAIYGWMRWVSEEQQRSGGTPHLPDIPPPPRTLVLVDALTREPRPLAVTGVREAQWPWPTPKPLSYSWLDDRDLA